MTSAGLNGAVAVHQASLEVRGSTFTRVTASDYAVIYTSKAPKTVVQGNTFDSSGTGSNGALVTVKSAAGPDSADSAPDSPDSAADSPDSADTALGGDSGGELSIGAPTLWVSGGCDSGAASIFFGLGLLLRRRR